MAQRLSFDERARIEAMRVLPDGRDHLATKDDAKAVENGLRVDFADLRVEFAELRADFAELRVDFADLRVEFADLRPEFAEQRSYIDSALAKHTRLHITTLVGFMLTTWGTMLVYIAA